MVYGEALHVVPVPKQARSLNRDAAMPGAAIVLGTRATPQDRIGAEQINARLADLGAPPLPVVGAREAPAAGTRILLGTPESSDALAAALDARRIQVTPGDPGPQGYIVDFAFGPNGAEVLLAGSDAQGALYACSTFRMLLEGRGPGVTATGARIRDWPDFRHRMCGRKDRVWGRLSMLKREPEGSQRAGTWIAEYVEPNKRVVDWCLQNKINWISLRSGVATYVEEWNAFGREALRQVADYGRERGVYFEAAATSSIDVGQWTSPDRPPWADEIVHTHGVGYCWSREDEIRKRARLLGEFARDIGASMYYLHAPDTGKGGYSLWDERCSLCKEKYADHERAQADARVMNLFAEEIQRLAPQCRICAVLVPYGASLDRMDRAAAQSVLAYWREANALLAEGIYICVREKQRHNMKAFHEAYAGRPVYFYNNPITSRGWIPLMATSPRCAKTGFFGERDDLYFLGVQAADDRTWRALVNNYGWNVNAPGAGWQRGFVYNPLLDTAGPRQVTGTVLRDICRYVYGPEIGPMVAEAETKIMAWSFLVDPIAVTNRMQDRLGTQTARPPGGGAPIRWNLESVPRLLELCRDGSRDAAAILTEAWDMVQAGRVPLTDEAQQQFERVYSYALACRALSSAMHAEAAAARSAAEGDLHRCRMVAAAGIVNIDRHQRALRALLEQIGEGRFFWDARHAAERTEERRQPLERLFELGSGFVVEDVDIPEDLAKSLMVFDDDAPGLAFRSSGNGDVRLTTEITRRGSRAAIEFTRPDHAWDGCSLNFDPVDISECVRKSGRLRLYINSAGPVGYQEMTFWMKLQRPDGSEARWKWVTIHRNTTRDHPGFITIDGIPATWQLLDIPLDQLCAEPDVLLTGFHINFCRVPPYGIVLDDIYITGDQPTVQERAPVPSAAEADSS
jgi:hypothetical protein